MIRLQRVAKTAVDRASVFMALVIAACGWHTGPDNQPTTPVSSSMCSPHQGLLIYDSIVAYVEPQSLAVRTGAAVVAGLPSYLFHLDTENQIVHVTSDSIVAAVIGRDGLDQLIPSPLPSRNLGWFRSAAAGADRWDFVFAELGAPRGEPGRDSVAALWAGSYGIEGWHDVRAIHKPAEKVRASSSSRLVSLNDTLVWVMVTDRQNWAEDVLVFTRTSGEWSTDRLQVPGAVEVALDMAFDRMYLSVSNADPDGGFQLLVYEGPPGWTHVGTIPEPRLVRTPNVLPSGDSLVAVWTLDFPLGGRQSLRSAAIRHDRTAMGSVVLRDALMWSPLIGSDVVAFARSPTEISLISLRGGDRVNIEVNPIDPGGLLLAASSDGGGWIVGGPAFTRGDALATTYALIERPCLGKPR